MAEQKFALGSHIDFDPRNIDWDIYRDKMTNYFIANNITDVTIKKAIILNSLSQDAFKLLCDLLFPVKPSDATYEIVLKTLSDFYKEEKAVFAERYKFYSAKKSSSESIQEWAARIKNLARDCEFSGHLEVALRDKFIMGLEPGKVRDKLFAQNKDCTLKEAVSIAKNTEIAITGYGIHGEEGGTQIKQEQIHKINQQVFTSQKKRTAWNVPRSSGTRGRGEAQRTHHSQWQKTSQATSHGCARCGRENHSSGDCRYKNYTCDSCKKKDTCEAYVNKTMINQI